MTRILLSVSGDKDTKCVRIQRIRTLLEIKISKEINGSLKSTLIRELRRIPVYPFDNYKSVEIPLDPT